jgi:hypothetical protein
MFPGNWDASIADLGDIAQVILSKKIPILHLKKSSLFWKNNSEL